MKITLVMVSSLNGLITKGHNPDIYRWTSAADQKLFFSLINKSRLIVMGSKTYEAVRSRIVLSAKRLRVVLTTRPERYAEEFNPGRLEFSSDSPKKLIAALAKRGYKELLLVGGGEANRTFLQSGLVDEMLITVEPLIFGGGKPMFAPGSYAKRLKLISSTKINSDGTLYLRYRVLKK